MAVPLHAGSGTRLKVLEAFAARVPVVSTAKGVEGLHLVDGVHYVRAETADDFAAAIDDLRRDPARAHAHRRGRACARRGTVLVARARAARTRRARHPDLLPPTGLPRAGFPPNGLNADAHPLLRADVPTVDGRLGSRDVPDHRRAAGTRPRGHRARVRTPAATTPSRRPSTGSSSGGSTRTARSRHATRPPSSGCSATPGPFIEEFAPDVIHAHDAPASLWMYLRFLRGRPHPPIVLTLHNVMGQQYADNERGLPGLITLMQEADWLTGVSEDVVADALTLDPSVEGRITLIRNGVVEPTLPVSPVPDGPPEFLAIGRLVRAEGLPPRDRRRRRPRAEVPRSAADDRRRRPPARRPPGAGRRSRGRRSDRVRGPRRPRRHPRAAGPHGRARDAVAVRRPAARRARSRLAGAAGGGDDGTRPARGRSSTARAACSSTPRIRARCPTRWNRSSSIATAHASSEPRPGAAAEQEWSVAACADGYEARVSRVSVHGDSQGGW